MVQTRAASDSRAHALLQTRLRERKERVQKRDRERKALLYASQKQAREELETKLAVQSALMSSCEASLKSSLKDPSSLQIHNRYPGSLQIEYSATNSFGGRIRSLLDARPASPAESITFDSAAIHGA